MAPTSQLLAVLPVLLLVVACSTGSHPLVPHDAASGFWIGRAEAAVPERTVDLRILTGARPPIAAVPLRNTVSRRAAPSVRNARRSPLAWSGIGDPLRMIFKMTSPRLRLPLETPAAVGLRDSISHVDVATLVPMQDVEAWRAGLSASTMRVSVPVHDRLLVYRQLTGTEVPEDMVLEILAALGWSRTRLGELHGNPSLRVTVGAPTADFANPAPADRLVAWQFVERDERMEGFPAPDCTGGTCAHYDRDGEPVGRRWLDEPVEGAWISSPFRRNRVHPVLKIRRPHYGVDFAAYEGTPVHAATHGEVIAAGRHGAAGLQVKLGHGSRCESHYAHLSRIADGMAPGVTVRKGDVIGYVGSTGLSTGPHLHYAVLLAGRFIDPHGADLPGHAPLAGPTLARLRGLTELVDVATARAGALVHVPLKVSWTEPADRRPSAPDLATPARRWNSEDLVQRASARPDSAS